MQYVEYMDHPLIDLINARITTAQKDGVFDNLQGAGKPLPECNDPENVVLDRILKETGAVPEFVSLTRELATLRAELNDTADRTKRCDIIKNMSLVEARIEIERNK